MDKKHTAKAFLTASLFLMAVPLHSATVRLKSIATIKGVRDNQLIGYGLVVGLERTGDTQRVVSTVQSVINMLSHFGVVTVPDQADS
jgi:flagellar P-ring protein FlgI